MALVIKKYCAVNPSGVFVNGKNILANKQGLPFKSFMKAIYRHLKLSYPKYFKMDGLSKLGFISTEVLLLDEHLSMHFPADRIGMLLTNRSSSIDIDQKHWDTIKDRSDYFPSPSNFVYTLPNIMAGESAIRHKIKGENQVFISHGFDGEMIHDAVLTSFASGTIDCCIGGWVEHDHNNYESLLFIIEERDVDAAAQMSAEDIIFEPLILHEIYKQKNANGRLNSETKS